MTPELTTQRIREKLRQIEALVTDLELCARHKLDPDEPVKLSEIKRLHCLRVLQECGSKTEAARLLGVNVKTLNSVLKGSAPGSS